MNELCKCGSGKELDGFNVNFNFFYRDFNLVVSRTGSECEDCSFNKRNIIILIDEYGEKLIKKGNALDFTVNWDFYCKFMKKEHGEESQSLNDILVALGRFSIDPKNNWMITDGSIGINPSWHSSPLYFTKENDVIAYAKLKFLDTLYNWEIRRISQVIKKGSRIFK